MRFLLLVCTAALLLSVTVAEDDPPKRDELEEQKSPSPPKADEPEAAKTPQKEDDPEAATSPPKEDEEDDAKSPPKEDEEDDSKSPPKEDDPEVIRFPSEYGSMGNRVAQANPYPRRYWTNRRNQQEQAIGRMAKRISEMQRNYALSKAKNMTLAAKMEAFNKKLYDVTMDLRRAEQQIENCKGVDTGNPLIPQRNVNSPSIGPVYTFRYIRLLRYLRANIDRELTAVTNLKWSREKGK
ncbi:serine/arginine repetitive matrix protein 5-like isoform X3 [Drosophila pseudoobscura]|uniref:Serine/arginine repetitive matrix protein 5-like isoform X3 n=1 Tax=Drosophila pseudoobscura pseudoobscura TaxID=46245 RepID=A0A6I8VY77_DROPS|nr:serine/arginine repetitive matrix protein 5 isoform X3 [Drosophila pseudoobscura]